MIEFGSFEWAVVAICALLVGINKTAVPGLGTLVVPLMAIVLPARSSVGVLLGMLILADIFAVVYYRRHANWSYVLRLMPLTLAGIVAGYFCLKVISNARLKPVIAVIVLAMLAINYWQNRNSNEESAVPTQWWFAAAMGFGAGVTTMMANAAGPIIVIYLLAMRLPKTEFVATSVWFFFIVNWLKVPFNANLGLMNAESVKLNLMMLPFIAAGAAAGILILKHISQKMFAVIVQLLAAAAAVRLLF